ncbi:MAG: hypothetical protein IKQ89_10490 [Muribaculaceae bacterium]|nr:hypothetical protein [Muribaculaceae bacterium]
MMTTIILFILVAALGAVAVYALLTAMKAQREVRQLHEATKRTFDKGNKDLQKLTEEMVRRINATKKELEKTELPTATIPPPAAVPAAPVPMRDPDKPKPPRKLYLAKPDDSGCFDRVADRFELGNSIFLLTTFDGINGTFTVIDNADVHRFAMMMPSENLMRACEGDAIQRADGKTRIVTDDPGTARFDNGQWRVINKARIHYR